MSSKKSVKKSLSFSASEEDQKLLATANATLEGDEFASFSELVKAALQNFFSDERPGDSTDVSSGESARIVQDERTQASLDLLNDQVQELSTNQNELLAEFKIQQESWKSESTAIQEKLQALQKEHVVAIEELFSPIQGAQQEIQGLLRQQGDELLAQLGEIQASTIPAQSNESNGQEKNGAPESGDALSYLSRFLEDF
ncbi:MAG: hypothetical protein AAF702_15545 [Chloroflexota bacterium]